MTSMKASAKRAMRAHLADRAERASHGARSRPSGDGKVNMRAVAPNAAQRVCKHRHVTENWAGYGSTEWKRRGAAYDPEPGSTREVEAVRRRFKCASCGVEMVATVRT